MIGKKNLLKKVYFMQKKNKAAKEYKKKEKRKITKLCIGKKRFYKHHGGITSCEFPSPRIVK